MAGKDKQEEADGQKDKDIKKHHQAKMAAARRAFGKARWYPKTEWQESGGFQLDTEPSESELDMYEKLKVKPINTTTHDGKKIRIHFVR